MFWEVARGFLHGKHAHTRRATGQAVKCGFGGDAEEAAARSRSGGVAYTNTEAVNIQKKQQQQKKKKPLHTVVPAVYCVLGVSSFSLPVYVHARNTLMKISWSNLQTIKMHKTLSFGSYVLYTLSSRDIVSSFCVWNNQMYTVTIPNTHTHPTHTLYILVVELKIKKSSCWKQQYYILTPQHTHH